MKKISCSIFGLIFPFILQCRSTNKEACYDYDKDPISPREEGFHSDDKLVVSGYGLSAKGLKSILQKEASAKNAARADGLRRALEICRATGIVSNASADMSAFADSAVAKDLANQFNDIKLKYSNCRFVGDLVGCKSWMKIEKKNIKKDCELTATSLTK